MIQLRDGLIWRYRAVYDYSLVARQMGLGIPRGGRLEHLTVLGAATARRALARFTLRPAVFGS